MEENNRLKCWRQREVCKELWKGDIAVIIERIDAVKSAILLKTKESETRTIIVMGLIGFVLVIAQIVVSVILASRL